MSVSRALRLALAVAAFSISPCRSGHAQSVDPAVVGERLQRLSAAVDAVEANQSSQRRQIEELGGALRRMREEISTQGNQRPWADDLKRQSDDLKRLATAIEEVDRKRIADHKQVLEILADLRKAVAAAAEPPPARGSGRGAADRGDRGDKSDDGGGTGGSGSGGKGKDRSPKNEAPPAEKYIEHVMEPGQSLSLVLKGFNEEAKKKGYQPLTVQQVMKFNKIADERRVPQGATLKLPLYPK